VCMQLCLRLEADSRPTCSQLLRHELFTGDGFAATITRQLRLTVCREYETNPLVAQTLKHRYDRCRRHLDKTGAEPLSGETRQITDDSRAYQSSQVNDILMMCNFSYLY